MVNQAILGNHLKQKNVAWFVCNVVWDWACVSKLWDILFIDYNRGDWKSPFSDAAPHTTHHFHTVSTIKSNNHFPPYTWIIKQTIAINCGYNSSMHYWGNTSWKPIYSFINLWNFAWSINYFLHESIKQRTDVRNHSLLPFNQAFIGYWSLFWGPSFLIPRVSEYCWGRQDGLEVCPLPLSCLAWLRISTQL